MATTLFGGIWPSAVVSWQIQDPVLVFAVVMLLMLVSPMLLSRFRVPGIVGLIVAGILVGPHGLGWFALDSTFELLGKVGLIYLMFLAGLEINFREFVRQRRHSLIFGSLTFLIPQIGGTLTARWLFGMPWPVAVLLASMFASHTLVTYPALASLNLVRNRAVTTAVGGTILTDIAALMVLAVVEQSTVGSLSVLFWVRQILLLGLLVTAVLWLLPRVGYWFFRRTDPDDVSEYLFIIASAFLCSYAATLAGVEPIIGAFLAGLALGQLVPGNSVLMNRVQFMGHALFIPFFLLSVGMRVDLSIVVRDARVWAVAAYMTVAVHVAKWLAAQAAGRWLRYSRAERHLLFGLSVNQAAATLAAVMVGVRIGLFDASILNGTILMILVSCLVGAWVTEAYGRTVAAEAEPVGQTDSGEERILIPLGNRMNVGPLMDFALLLRNPDAQGSLFALNVALDGPRSEAHLAEGESLLEEAVLRAVATDVPVEPLARIDLNRAGGILRVIREKRITFMILGWRGQREGLGRFFQDVLGQILDHTSIGLFVPWLPAPVNTIRRMLLTIPPMSHRQPGFKDAVRRCIRLASQMEASVLVLAGADAAAALPLPSGADKKAGWTTKAIGDWTTWPAILASETQPSDMLAVIAARRGRPPWRAGLDRSLQQLHADYPGNNLLIVYPSEAESDAKPMALAGEAPVDSALPFDRDTPLREALDELVAAMVSSPVAREDVIRRVRRADPIPLSEGIALFHIHTPHVKGSKIGAGVSLGGAVLADGADSFKLVLLLLSQQGLEPHVHLQSLAAVARMARKPSVIEDLRSRTRNPADAASDGREGPAAG